MKRFLNKITEMLADAALLEMGVAVQTTAEYRSKTVFEPVMSPLKRLFQNLTDTLADAALLEMGVHVATPAAAAGTDRESLEENLIEVAFAEAADYDDIHESILREHRQERDIAHPDDCQYGDNDLCFV
jgi:hypothetical protein